MSNATFPSILEILDAGMTHEQVTTEQNPQAGGRGGGRGRGRGRGRGSGCGRSRGMVRRGSSVDYETSGISGDIFHHYQPHHQAHAPPIVAVPERQPLPFFLHDNIPIDPVLLALENAPPAPLPPPPAPSSSLQVASMATEVGSKEGAPTATKIPVKQTGCLIQLSTANVKRNATLNVIDISDSEDSKDIIDTVTEQAFLELFEVLASSNTLHVTNTELVEVSLFYGYRKTITLAIHMSNNHVIWLGGWQDMVMERHAAQLFWRLVIIDMRAGAAIEPWDSRFRIGISCLYGCNLCPYLATEVSKVHEILQADTLTLKISTQTVKKPASYAISKIKGKSANADIIFPCSWKNKEKYVPGGFEAWKLDYIIKIT
ncbi:hypothetical protein SCHPADRAFT_889841 [Schizopora paradoxa]|uniref:Uncharacterized protein n=1 Tax=Schizopora paradoxa TaxID=27342 RepID=A0A0H2RP39_9AGAM|nr:hypothetical protein SCHPADRAFT_889841 [Schizopora paradoxa]